MLEFDIIETRVEPEYRFGARFLFFIPFFFIILITSSDNASNKSSFFDGNEGWLLLSFFIFLIIAVVFYYKRTSFYKLNGTLQLNIENFIISKTDYTKTYSYKNIQEVRYGRKIYNEAYRIEFDDIVLLIKVDRNEQEALDKFIEENILPIPSIP